MKAADAQLNVYNFAAMCEQPPRKFNHLRVDTNNDCNLHCVYCHNHRSSDLIDLEELRTFLECNVVSVDNFQIGCVMEPTLDRRLGDIMLLVRDSRARPRREFMLQTNGLLLHIHDHGKFRDSGLNCLSVSIDSANPDTLKKLRGGTKLSKVAKNVTDFRESCPLIDVVFISTVTSANVHEMESLVAFGLDLGVTRFVMRDIFYHEDNDVVDHAKVPGLLVHGGDFAGMKERLLARYQGRAHFFFADTEALATFDAKMKTDSFR